MSLLTLMGYQTHRLGHPLSEEVLRRDHWIRKGILGVLALLALAALILTVAMLMQSPRPGPFLVVLGSLPSAMILSYAWVRMEGLTRAGKLEPLPAERCPEVLAWAQAHAGIHAHVAQITAQARPLYLSDWHFLNTVWQQQRAAAAEKYCQAACQTLHNLS